MGGFPMVYISTREIHGTGHWRDTAFGLGSFYLMIRQGKLVSEVSLSDTALFDWCSHCLHLDLSVLSLFPPCCLFLFLGLIQIPAHGFQHSAKGVRGPYLFNMVSATMMVPGSLQREDLFPDKCHEMAIW